MKNVILITIDSLRADHLGSLGYHKKLTPNLDKIAKDGILFTQAFSYGSTTSISILPLLTSMPVIPYYSGLFKNEKMASLEDITKNYKELGIFFLKLKPTIAGVLKHYGYETAAFNSNPYLSKYFGFGKDFTHFDDGSFYEHGYTKIIERKIKKILVVNKKIESFARFLLCLTYQKVPFERAEDINKKAISWVMEKKPEKFFLWLHYMDTHIPYIPPKDFHNLSNFKVSDLNRKVLDNENVSKSELNQIIKLYDGCINYVDSSIKSLLDDLSDRRLLDDTIVIITADHGEEFKDHGGFMHIESKLYDELLHVPLIIYGANYSNVTIDEPVSLIDIAPTITDLLNLNSPRTFQGKSLIPIIKGTKSTGIISQGGHHGMNSNAIKMMVAYRTRRWKYILDERGGEELYDIKEDPKETKNLSVIQKDVAELIKSGILYNLSHQHKLVESDMKKEDLKKKIGKLRKLEMKI